MSGSINNQEAPAWFQRALDYPSIQARVRVAGCPINYRVWGEEGRPGVILIHGSNAHLEWWRFVAPWLAGHFRVAALDLSGNGDSGWRKRYSGALFAQEIKAVCDAALGPGAFIVGHSFGGFTALSAAAEYDAEIGGLVLMDYTVQPPEQFVEWGNRAKTEGPARPTRIYPDLETALGRFRLLPEQPCQHPRVLDYMARQSLRRVPGGWTWKFDPGLFDYLEMGPGLRDSFVRLQSRSALILGEHSTDEGAEGGDYMREISRGLMPVFHIPTTYHHLMFDEPLAVASALLGILLSWVREDHADALRDALKLAEGQ